MAFQKLFGEKATTKVAAIFDGEEQMASVAASLQAGTQLRADQIKTVRPTEPDVGRKLEPEGRGIVRTALKAHMILGLAGLAVGFLVWLVLYSAGVIAVVSSPAFSAGVLLFFFAIAGLLLGGLITARPDHQLVIQRVLTASEEGRWSLVIHPASAAQLEATLRVLDAAGVEPIRTV